MRRSTWPRPSHAEPLTPALSPSPSPSSTATGGAAPRDGHQTTLTATTGDHEAAAEVSKQALYLVAIVLRLLRGSQLIASGCYQASPTDKNERRKALSVTIS